MLVRLLLPCLVCLAAAALALRLAGAVVGGLSEAGGRLAREARQAEALERLRQVTLQVTGPKHQAAEAVASGRLSLDEAVGVFRRLNRQMNEAAAGVPDAFPHPEDDATLREQVLSWVKNLHVGADVPPAEGPGRCDAPAPGAKRP